MLVQMNTNRSDGVKISKTMYLCFIISLESGDACFYVFCKAEFFTLSKYIMEQNSKSFICIIVSYSLQSSSLLRFSSVLCLYIKLRSGRAGQLLLPDMIAFKVYTLFIDLMIMLQLVFYQLLQIGFIGMVDRKTRKFSFS